MEQVAIHHFMNEISTVKEGLRQTELSRKEALNLLMQLLCFVMEKSLLEQACTLKDMAAYIGFLHIEQGYDNLGVDYEELARYLVRDALQNKGKPYYFESYDFGNGKGTSYYIRLIEDRLIQVDHKEEFSYNLTAQGFQFLFSTLEVEEALQMNFEQLRLKYAIQKRNFGSAKESVDNLFTLNRKQIQKIQEYIHQIKEDIGLFSAEDYEETYRTTFDTLNEQKEKHEELYQLIMTTKDQYIHQHMDHINAKIQEDLKYIDYIQRRLQQLLGEQLKMFKEQQNLSEVYDDAISNVLYIGFENRLNIEKDLLEPFESSVMSLEGLACILKPLLLPKMKRSFNFNQIYATQRIEEEGLEVEASPFFLEEKYDEEAQRLYLERIAYIQEAYDTIVSQLLEGILSSPERKVKLSQMFQECDEVELLRNVLMQLHNDHYLDIVEILKNGEEYVYAPGEDFDLGYTLSRIKKHNEGLSRLKSIYCQMLSTTKITLQSKRTKRYLRCHEMYFSEEGDQ
jgi:hypothetical protein